MRLHWATKGVSTPPGWTTVAVHRVVGTPDTFEVKVTVPVGVPLVSGVTSAATVTWDSLAKATVSGVIEVIDVVVPAWPTVSPVGADSVEPAKLVSPL